MKISVICMGRSSCVRAINGKDVIFHSVDFAVKREKTPALQKFHGTIHLESVEHFHYKERNEYAIVLSELITVIKPNQMPGHSGYGVNQN